MQNYRQFTSWLNEAKRVREEDDEVEVTKKGKAKVVVHDGDEDGSRVTEELKGKQHKLDKNKNGRLDAHDFELLRKEEEELDESWMSQRSSYDGPGKGKLLGDMSEKEHVDAINYHGTQIHQLKTGTHKYSKMYTKQQAADKLAQHMKHYTDHKDAYDAHTMKEEEELDEAQYGVNLGSRPVSGQKEYQGKEIKSFHPNKEKEAREFAKKHGYVVKKKMLAKDGNSSITHTWDIHKEEVELEEADQKIKVTDVKSALKNVKNASSHTKKMIKANPTQKMPYDSSRHAAYSEEFELDEAIKLNSKIVIHDPGESHHGKVGYVGEIRHGAYKGAPKTYTVDYDHDESTGRSKSIQLDKKNIKLHKEEVELNEAKVATFSTKDYNGNEYNFNVFNKDGKHSYQIKGKHSNFHPNVAFKSGAGGDRDTEAHAKKVVDLVAAGKHKEALAHLNTHGKTNWVQTHKESVELDEANFADTMKKAIAAHERGDHARAKYHLDNAKTARYAMKSTEISKNKDLLDKYKELRDMHEETDRKLTYSQFVASLQEASACQEEFDLGQMIEEGKVDKNHPIVKEYDAMKKHDIKTLRGMVKQQHRIFDTSELRTKDHAISTYLRAKHGNKKVDQAFGFSEEVELAEAKVDSSHTFQPGDVVNVHYKDVSGKTSHGTSNVDKATSAYVHVRHPKHGGMIKFHQGINGKGGNEVGTWPGSRAGGYVISKKTTSEEVELSEAKIPVQHATDAVHKVLGQKSAVKFLTHLRPGTEKHTSWDKVNDALVKQGVKPQHIASIATHVKPAQYEEFELDEDTLTEMYGLDDQSHLQSGDKVTLHRKGFSKTQNKGEHTVDKVTTHHFTLKDKNGETVADDEGKPLKFKRKNGAALDKKETSSSKIKGMSWSIGHYVKSLKEDVELDEGIKSVVHNYLAKRAGKKADDAYDMGDEKEFQKQVDKSEYHRVKAGGKPTRINKNPDAKFLTTREEVELDESVKIIDRDSDLDQEHFKLSVNGKPVHFVHHNYEGGHATDSKQDIHYQVKNQLKHLSDADKKKVTDAVHASYRMKEEFELDEAFKPGDKVTYETSKYSKDNKGVVHSVDGEHVTIKGHDMLGKPHHIEIHQGFVKKIKESFELDEENLHRVIGQVYSDDDQKWYHQSYTTRAKSKEHAVQKAKEQFGKRGQKFRNVEHDAEMHESVELDEGQTVKTSTGYVHKGSYGSEYDTDEEGNEKKKAAPEVKRSRGRPKKGADETGEVKKYTFHDLLNRLSR